MNLLRAEAYVQRFNSGIKLSEVYDDDDLLSSALFQLFPDFEYPDFSHRTMGEICRMYAANPRPLVG